VPDLAEDTSTPRRAPALSVDDRREMILDAAVPLIIEYGQNVTTKQIAEAAGIAEGTIFRAFGDKQELLAAAVKRFMDPAPFRTAIEAIDSDATLEAKVRAIVELLRERFTGIMGIMQALGGPERHGVKHSHTGEPGDPHLAKAQMAGIVAGVLETESNRLRLDPTTSAHLIRLLVFASEIPPFNEARRLTTDELVDFILRGIAREDG
jgi:AcrR family transcriptional regulator